MNKRGSNSYSSGIIEETADATKTTDVVKARFREGRKLIGKYKVKVDDETCGMREVNNSLR